MDSPIFGAGNGAANAAPAGDLIKDADMSSFMVDVIEASNSVPVIVDFWAPWCGPCKQLTPVLEKTVKAAKGAVKLVKVNIDENQEIAQQMRIQSIPAVFAFKQGKPVDGFMGALPEGQIKQFIERLTGETVGAETEAMIEAGKAALEAGDLAAAAQTFGAVLQGDRENIAAIAGLARCQLANDDLEGATATLALTPPAKVDDPDIASVRASIELASAPADDADVARLSGMLDSNPDDHETRLELAVALNAAGRREEALDHLIEMIAKDRAWNEEAARKQLLQFFEAWGPTDEMTVAGRRRLSSILFS